MKEGAFEALEKMFTPYADKTMMQVMSEATVKDGRFGPAVGEGGKGKMIKGKFVLDKVEKEPFLLPWQKR